MYKNSNRDRIKKNFLIKVRLYGIKMFFTTENILYIFLSLLLASCLVINIMTHNIMFLNVVVSVFLFWVLFLLFYQVKNTVLKNRMFKKFALKIFDMQMNIYNEEIKNNDIEIIKDENVKNISKK